MDHIWEWSQAKLEQEIEATEHALRFGGYNKQLADHLAVLQEQRDKEENNDATT